jgi:hypothetical protein
MPGLSNAPMTLGRVLKYEAANFFSRETVTILAGSGAERALEMGQVLGKISKGAASAAAGGSNTGDGAAGAVTLGAKAKVGDYELTCIEAAANGGVFQVVDPDGNLLPNLTVATAYAGQHINLTISDGASDFALGDSFTITVAAGSGKVVAIDFSAVDGSQVAAGVLGLGKTAPDGSDVQSWAIEREAIVASNNLVWPAGATTDQKTQALAELAALGVISRVEV